MKQLIDYINEKLVINKNFDVVKDNLEERLFDLLGYDGLPKRGDGEAKYIMNWIRHGNINDFKVYILKSTLDFIVKNWENVYKMDYEVLTFEEFEKVIDDAFEGCNYDYDNSGVQIMTKPDSLIYYDKYSDNIFLVKSV